MTTGEKISRLRKENNYTQEQLAELLGVSRQSVSKYESGLAYPETAKLIKLSEVFDCTVDYLLRENAENEKATTTSIERNDMPTADDIVSGLVKKTFSFEKKSKRTIGGVPLWHIGKNAKGIIAVGLKARGVISIGLLSLGVVSLGVVSLGLLALGVIAIGALSAGSIALGLVACGAISVGILSVGAVAVGEFSIGALAKGHYFAYGDHASAMFAFGKTEVSGAIFESTKELTEGQKQNVITQMYQKIPAIYKCIVDLVSKLL